MTTYTSRAVGWGPGFSLGYAEPMGIPWENPSTWIPQGIPGPNDDVIISNASCVSQTYPQATKDSDGIWRFNDNLSASYYTVNSLEIMPGGTLTHFPNSWYDIHYSNERYIGERFRVFIKANSIYIHSNREAGGPPSYTDPSGTLLDMNTLCGIDVQDRGYLPGDINWGGTKLNGGPGCPPELYGGASHGGMGPVCFLDGTTRAADYTYGDFRFPSELGSGMRCDIDPANIYGKYSGYDRTNPEKSNPYLSSGCGSGAIKLIVNGELHCDGRISAGKRGLGDFPEWEMYGSAGSIWIICDVLTGSGIIEASVGPRYYFANVNLTYASCGAGRVAIYYKDMSEFTGSIDASGHPDDKNSTGGTVYLRKRIVSDLGHWQFDNNCLDSSEYKKHLTPVNSPEYVAGKLGTAADLSRYVMEDKPSKQYYYIDDTEDSYKLNETFTIEGWVKSWALYSGDYAGIISKDNAWYICVRCLDADNLNYSLRVRIKWDNGSETIEEVEFPIDEWVYYTITKDNEWLYIYLNGELKSKIELPQGVKGVASKGVLNVGNLNTEVSYCPLCGYYDEKHFDKYNSCPICGYAEELPDEPFRHEFNHYWNGLIDEFKINSEYIYPNEVRNNYLDMGKHDNGDLIICGPYKTQHGNYVSEGTPLENNEVLDNVLINGVLTHHRRLNGNRPIPGDEYIEEDVGINLATTGDLSIMGNIKAKGYKGGSYFPNSPFFEYTFTGNWLGVYINYRKLANEFYHYNPDAKLVFNIYQKIESDWNLINEIDINQNYSFNPSFVILFSADDLGTYTVKVEIKSSDYGYGVRIDGLQETTLEPFSYRYIPANSSTIIWSGSSLEQQGASNQWQDYIHGQEIYKYTTSRGMLGKSGFGSTVGFTDGSYGGSGGSHGGLGGKFEYDYRTQDYDSAETPAYMGAGGGANGIVQIGGEGGGRISLQGKINVSGKVDACGDNANEVFNINSMDGKLDGLHNYGMWVATGPIAQWNGSYVAVTTCKNCNNMSFGMADRCIYCGATGDDLIYYNNPKWRRHDTVAGRNWCPPCNAISVENENSVWALSSSYTKPAVSWWNGFSWNYKNPDGLAYYSDYLDSINKLPVDMWAGRSHLWAISNKSISGIEFSSEVLYSRKDLEDSWHTVEDDEGIIFPIGYFYTYGWDCRLNAITGDRNSGVGVAVGKGVTIGTSEDPEGGFGYPGPVGALIVKINDFDDNSIIVNKRSLCEVYDLAEIELFGAWVSPTENVWAVGGRGVGIYENIPTILTNCSEVHHDDITFGNDNYYKVADESLRNVDAYYDVDGINDNYVWIVGSDNTILFWNGEVFTDMMAFWNINNDIDVGDIKKVHCLAPDDIWFATDTDVYRWTPSLGFHRPRNLLTAAGGGAGGSINVDTYWYNCSADTLVAGDKSQKVVFRGVGTDWVDTGDVKVGFLGKQLDIEVSYDKVGAIDYGWTAKAKLDIYDVNSNGEFFRKSIFVDKGANQWLPLDIWNNQDYKVAMIVEDEIDKGYKLTIHNFKRKWWENGIMHEEIIPLTSQNVLFEGLYWEDEENSKSIRVSNTKVNVKIIGDDGFPKDDSSLTVENVKVKSNDLVEAMVSVDNNAPLGDRIIEITGGFGDSSRLQGGGVQAISAKGGDSVYGGGGGGGRIALKGNLDSSWGYGFDVNHQFLVFHNYSEISEHSAIRYDLTQMFTPSLTNVETEIYIQGNTQTPGIVLCMDGESGNESGYVFKLNTVSSKAQIYKLINGEEIELREVDFIFNSNYWYRLIAYVGIDIGEGLPLCLKTWDTANEEPDTWTIETTDSTPLESRHIGLYDYSCGGYSRFRDIVIYNNRIKFTSIAGRPPNYWSTQWGGNYWLVGNYIGFAGDTLTVAGGA